MSGDVHINNGESVNTWYINKCFVGLQWWTGARNWTLLSADIL